MYKEYKQWKQIFAHPLFLIGYAIIAFMIVTAGLNFLLGTASNLLEGSFSTGGGLGSYIEQTVNNTVEGQATATTSSLFQVSYLWTFQGQWWQAYLVVYIIVSFLIGRKIYAKRMAYRNILLGLKGTMRWTTLDEIKQQYHAIPTNHQPYEGSAGIPIIHYDGFVYIDVNKTNALIDASTQSGKTETFTYPFLDSIMRASEKDSVVILDIKGNILKNTKEEFEKFGFLVKVFNLLDPHLSIGFNPLELVKKAYWKGDVAQAQMLAQTLSFSFYNNEEAKDPLWQQASITLLNAIILAVCEECKKANTPEKVTLFTCAMMLLQLAKDPDEDGLTGLDYYFMNLSDLNPAKLSFATIEFSKSVTRSSIYTGTTAELQKYLLENVAKLTAQNDFDFEELTEGEKPVALFVLLKDWDDSLNDLASSFLSQESAVLSELAVRSKKSKLSRKVHHIYEEIGNVPPIPNLPRYMGVGLERGLLYYLVIQSFNKLESAYGENAANDMKELCGNWIYIMSEATDDAEVFSKKLGKTSVISPNRNGDPMSDDKSYGEQEDSRELMMPEELTKLVEGERVILRTKKRRNLKNKKVKPFPIFASEDAGTAMLHRYEYLLDYFDKELSFDELGLESTHQNLQLEDLMLHFSTEERASDVPGQVPLKAVPEERSEFPMNDVEEVHHTETPISDVLTKDQYNFISSMIKENTSNSAFACFSSFDTMEEIITFLEAPEHRFIYDQVSYLVEKEGA
ncbi:TPA: type IV secretory system conjugative DNA transfer family protein [Listeria monocytogenes]|nr:type IV secretory system conjugative DNA transfer family protein [Listeria monocytogenes]EAG3119322.1 type IV secretory system conjugative DNA transfer family protein [Listeria monocytogenes]EHY0418800.1 type IV secretory system conjugative DNA transfer family protein [Listeria monocytogenes]HAO5770062.1 type IV secretory system conjugative DNA transfer family protein [Listeria monocytogenes]HAO5983767.1 type IV secretory system conjugative DNA transfer family protein [Listeria monocytogenes